MKKTIIYLTTILTAAGLNAETLSPAQALARVEGASSARKIASRAAAEASPARVIALDSEPQLYVFTPTDGGMLLVSAESETPALIGYTDNYRPGDEIPPALEGMMRCWAAEIEAQRSGNVLYSGSRRDAEDFEPIEPICKTKWDQGSPYNAKCPVLNGSRTYTGCVATAMSQILKVFEYPTKCSGGTYSYKWSSGNKTLSLNFDDVELDWANMLNSYTSSATQEQKDAVATLMQAVGYSANMEYTGVGSGAIGTSMFIGLIRNFDYDAATLQYCSRAWFTLSDWRKKVYDTLAEGHPVYYDGQTNDASPMGHAFVVDGYRADGYFHLNWGWSGMSDGYFLLTALDPDAQGIGGAYASAGYDAQQNAIFGMKPGNTMALIDTPLNFAISGGFKTSAKSTMLGSRTTFESTGFANYSATAAEVIPAIKLTADADGREYYISSGTNYGSLNVSYQFRSLSFSIPMPSDLPEGNYTITPAIYRNSDKQYFDVHCNIGQGAYVYATVTGSTISYSTPASPQLKVESLDIPEQIYSNVAFNVSGAISCTGGQSYYDNVSVRLYRTNSSGRVANLGSFILSVDNDSSSEFSCTCTLSSASVTSGEYRIALIDASGNNISGYKDIEVIMPDDAGSLRASDLKCLNNWNEHLEFEVTLAASDGNYKGPVYIQLHKKGNYNKYEIIIESEPVEIENGQSETVTISGSFPEGINGQDYTAYVYYTHLGEWTEASGRQRLNFTMADQSLIDEISAEQAADIRLYDLSGRRVLTPRPGIYLRSQGSQTTKVLIK